VFESLKRRRNAEEIVICGWLSMQRRRGAVEEVALVVGS
jgi:hypothetical protein